jgi:hypothetical protein
LKIALGVVAVKNKRRGRRPHDKDLWTRGRFPELRIFLERNKAPLVILDGLLRNKKYHPYLPVYERLAEIINRTTTMK